MNKLKRLAWRVAEFVFQFVFVLAVAVLVAGVTFWVICRG